MHNYKKLIAIPLAAVALFTSCSKTLNAESAKKWVDAQYANKTVKQLNELDVIATVKDDYNIDETKKLAKEFLDRFSKSFKITYTEGSLSLRGKADKNSDGFKKFESEDFCGVILNSKGIQEYEENKKELEEEGTASVTYTINSGEISVFTKGFAKDIEKAEVKIDDTITNLDIYNTNGQLRYFKTSETLQTEGEDKKSLSATLIVSCSFVE